VVHSSVDGSGVLFEFVDDKMQVLGGLTLAHFGGPRCGMWGVSRSWPLIG
jgi:hypothetical protein